MLHYLKWSYEKKKKNSIRLFAFILLEYIVRVSNNYSILFKKKYKIIPHYSYQDLGCYEKLILGSHNATRKQHT